MNHWKFVLTLLTAAVMASSCQAGQNKYAESKGSESKAGQEKKKEGGYSLHESGSEDEEGYNDSEEPMDDSGGEPMMEGEDNTEEPVYEEGDEYSEEDDSEWEEPEESGTKKPAPEPKKKQ